MAVNQLCLCCVSSNDQVSPPPVPPLPASVGVQLAGVHQPDGVAGVVDVEVEGDAPHDDQPERELQDLNHKCEVREL